MNNLPRDFTWPGLEPATSRLQVRRPIHYATAPCDVMANRIHRSEIVILIQSALKVDVTSVVNEAARRRPIVVVVVSNVTTSRDVVKMVAQKLGMDRQRMCLMGLVAMVNYRSHQMLSDYRKLHESSSEVLKPRSWS